MKEAIVFNSAMHFWSIKRKAKKYSEFNQNSRKLANEFMRHEVHYGPLRAAALSPVRNLLPEHSSPRHERGAFGGSGAPWLWRQRGGHGSNGHPLNTLLILVHYELAM